MGDIRETRVYKIHPVCPPELPGDSILRAGVPALFRLRQKAVYGRCRRSRG